MVNFDMTLPLREFTQKGKGLALVSVCLGVELLYDLGRGVVLWGNFGYCHLGASLFPDSLGGCWQVLDLTGDLRHVGARSVLISPIWNWGGGFWLDRGMSAPTLGSSLSYQSSLGQYGSLGSKSTGPGGVAYELAVKLYRFAIEEEHLVPPYEFFVASPSEISWNCHSFSVDGTVLFNIPVRF